MTNQEYLTAILGKFGVTDQEIVIIMLEQNIDPNGTVTGSSDIRSLKVAVYNQLPQMLAGMQDVSEGGYSIKWNLDGIKMWYSWLADELGLPDKLNTQPTVTGAKPW
ncbi:DUF6706 family protein [Chitinophaga japonensis]|uniref:Uncharacterized protein n=1 Tax=Chitinophaga japonensis TaxID=104662 RepID=A0A562SYB4_CHIJA|nr:DUF6706 family protein [Chitinophaga japonensis]TWI86301.1 hypothetical protein LX66_3555 [Chitinophaga japonensis]